MKLARSSGILLHPTSLPSRFGIGDLGPECYHFLDFLYEAKQKLWHILPLGPTGPENSPYQCRSTFAGNPLLISPEEMVREGYLRKRDLAAAPNFPSNRIAFGPVISYKFELFRRAFLEFNASSEYQKFEKKHAWWLEPYAQFMALRTANHGVSWTKFDPSVAPDEEAIHFHKFLQYEFFRQWHRVRNYCARNGIVVMGDMPFYVHHDSAEVWHSPELFDLRRNGEPRTVGGVPPDYFSRNGQLWGNPTYRWPRLKKVKYKLWVDRFRAAFETVDLLRLDHFRGFVKFWSVPASYTTAKKGKWENGPGQKLFEIVRDELGDLPLVAENLGYITPEVEDLRRKLELPGMVVLQFAFGEEGTHRPNNYVRELVSFTGTHDNNTTRGWWRELNRVAKRQPRSAAACEIERAKAFLQTDGEDISWSFIQAIMASVADVSIIPMQDVLSLDSSARMNVPGRAKGNWGWRYKTNSVTPAITERLRKLTKVTGRGV